MFDDCKDWKPRFFAIWIGQAFSVLGSRVAQFALVWWITEQVHSVTALTFATMIGMVPEILLGPIAGALVDRWNRRVVMILADGGVAVVSLILAVLFWTGHIQIWHIYLAMVFRGVGGAFHWPAMLASTPLMVPKEHLTRTEGMNQTLFGVISIFGPPLGVLAMEGFGLHGAMLVDVISASLAISPLFFVRFPKVPRRQRDNDGDSLWRSICHDLVIGWRYIWGWRGLMVLVVITALYMLVSLPVLSLLPLLVKDYFGGGASELSFLEIAIGAGVVVGGLALSLWGGTRRKSLLTVSSIVIGAVAIVVLGCTPASWFGLAMVCTFVIGLMQPFTDGPVMAIMQSVVAPELQGRVISLSFSLFTAASPLGLMIAGPMADRIGLQTLLVIAGVLCGLVGLAGFFVPGIADLEENAEMDSQRAFAASQEL